MKKFSVFFVIILSLGLIGAATKIQKQSNTATQDEGPTRNVSHFPINPEDYIPMPIPEPGEVAVTQVENRWISYNMRTGREIIRDSAYIEPDVIGRDRVSGGLRIENITTDGTGIQQSSKPRLTDQNIGSIKAFSSLFLISSPENYPWNVNCKLYMSFAGGNYVGSGVLIDPMHVLTAGHCVHDVLNGGTWATSITVVPGYELGSTPYGDASAVQLHSWTGWTVDANWDHDMALIDLDRPIGALTGWHGYGYNNSPSFYTTETFNNPGYPAESPYDGRYLYNWNGTFDFTETILGIWTGHEVGINRRAYAGQSGSGAYYIDGSNRTVYAVLSNTVKVAGGPTKFPRITSTKYDNIKNSWISTDTPSSYDFIPLDVQAAPSPIVAGNQLSSFSYVVHNYSSASRSGWVEVDYYLSTNNNISTADTLLKTEFFLHSFGPKSSVRVTSGSPPAIPLSTPSGGRWLGVILDISDYNTGNNDSDGQDAAPITIIAAGALSVSPAEGMSASGTQGGPFGPSPKYYTLTNTGGSAITWTASKTQTWVTLSNSGGTLNPGATASTGVFINSNANPLTPGTYNDTVTFTNTTNSLGTTTRPVSLTVNPVIYPDIRTPITSISFGNVTVGSPSNKTTTIYNDGTAQLTVYSITRSSGSSEFTYVSPTTPFNIPASGSQDITVQFLPTSAGLKTADFNINSNDPDESDVTFNVSGTGKADVVKADFNNDGFSDILWRNYTHGTNALWNMNSSTIIGAAYLATIPNVDWQIAGTGDFNSDGQEDVLWRNYVTGSNALWYMNGSTIIGTTYLTTIPNVNWRIGGTGDFNGDMNVDILWNNYVTGQNAVWYMSGGTIIGTAYMLTSTDLDFRMEGTGDFNGDGNVDILWRNYVTGENAVWYMNGSTYTGSAFLNLVADTNWQIEGTGDFNGDGNMDILWRNYVTGSNALWYMNGSTIVGTTYLITIADVNWRIENH